jgi:peptidoglycan/LPS O-acetylase OafA/YrhL
MRFDELEGYRGLAALTVIVFHAYQSSRVATAFVYQGSGANTFLSNLDGGVALFFVLSGFLIFLPFARAAVDRGRSESARGFLIRRAIRIIPLYYVAILVVWSLRYNGTWSSWQDLIEHLTFVQVFDPVRIFYTIGPAWSLADEVIFYMVTALVGWGTYRLCARLVSRKARLRLMFAVVGAIVLAGIAYQGSVFYLARIPATNFAVYFAPQARIDEFGLGMLLSLVLLSRGERPLFSAPGAVAAWAGGVAVVTCAFIFRFQVPVMSLYFPTVCAIGFALLLSATVLGPRGFIFERALANPVLSFVGMISYSVYIWHEPIMLQFGDWGWLNFQDGRTWPFETALLLLVAIGIGWVSYWVIEKPAQEIRHLFNRQGRLGDRYVVEPLPAVDTAGPTKRTPHTRVG